MRSKAVKSSSAFTLIEVVLAVSILAVVLGTAYSALTQILSVKTILDDKRDVTILANSLIRRLTREFQLSIAEKPVIFRDDAPGGSNNSAAYFYAESKGMGAAESRDRVTFIAQEAGQYMPDGGTHSGLVQITYRAEEDPENDTDRERLVLVREEVPYIEPSSANLNSYQRAKDKAFSQAMIFPVTSDLVSFRLRFYDVEQETWRDEWDHEQLRRIPGLVQLSFSLKSPRGHVYAYSTIIPVQAGIG